MLVFSKIYRVKILVDNVSERYHQLTKEKNCSKNCAKNMCKLISTFCPCFGSSLFPTKLYLLKKNLDKINLCNNIRVLFVEDKFDANVSRIKIFASTLMIKLEKN